MTATTTTNSRNGLRNRDFATLKNCSTKFEYFRIAHCPLRVLIIVLATALLIRIIFLVTALLILIIVLVTALTD